MKQILFAITMTILCISLSAQTGLFGISFGQTSDSAQKMLVAAGFKVESNTEGKITFSNPKIKGLTELAVEFGTSEGVTSWEIKYDTTDHSGLTAEITKQLTELHDVEPWWDDYWEEWVWELENDMAIYMYESGEFLRIDYDVWDDSYEYWW